MAEPSKTLDGVVLASTAICAIDGEKGELTYRGYDIEDLVEHATYEDVLFALWHGALPGSEEAAAFRHRLADARRVPPAVLEVLRALPAGVKPLAALRTAVSLLGNLDPDSDTRVEDREGQLRLGERMHAGLSWCAASWPWIRRGFPAPGASTASSLPEDLLRALTGQTPRATEVRAFEQCLILYADHEFNTSTFACRVVASAASDLPSCVCTGIGALRGPQHGGANAAVIGILREVSERGGAAEADAWVSDALANKRKIPGFGQRVYRHADPRAVLLERIARRLAAETERPEWLSLAESVERAVRRQRNVLPNIDLYSATVYATLGIPTDAFGLVFAVARAAGWIAHAMEQSTHSRMVRPRSEYTGEALRPVSSRPA